MHDRGYANRSAFAALALAAGLCLEGGLPAAAQEFVADPKPVATFTGHPQKVNALAFSPEGDLLAAAGYAGFGFGQQFPSDVLLWDVKTGKVAATLKGHKQAINAVAFSVDGKTIATASGDGNIKLWDRTGKELKTLPLWDWAWTVAFSPDGKLVAAGGRDNKSTGVLKLFDAKTFLEVRSLKVEATVRKLCFSADSKRLVVASDSNGGKVEIVDLTTDAMAVTLESKYQISYPIDALALAADGKTVAVASGSSTLSDTPKLALWDAATGKGLYRLKGHKGLVDSLAAIPNSKWIVSGIDESRSGTIPVPPESVKPGKVIQYPPNWTVVKVWDTGSGREVAHLESPRDNFPTSKVPVAISHDGKFIAAGLGNGAILWPTPPYHPVTILRGHSAVFSPDGKTLAVAAGKHWLIADSKKDKRQTLKLHDLVTGKEQLVIERENGEELEPLHFLPGEKLLFLLKPYQANPKSPPAFVVWDLKEGKQLERIEAPANKCKLSLCSSSALRTFPGFSGVRAMGTLSANGLQLAILHTLVGPKGIETLHGKVWDLTGASKPLDLQPLHLQHPDLGLFEDRFRLAFTAEGKRLTLARSGHGVYHWDVATGKSLPGWKLPKDCVLKRFTPDGATLISFKGAEVIKTDETVLWDVATGKEKATWKGHRSGLFSPDGKTMAQFEYKEIVLWDFMTGQKRATIKLSSEGMYTLTFTPDSKTLVGVDYHKNKVQTWDSATGHPQASLKVHLFANSGGSWLQCSPDGRTLAAGVGEDGNFNKEVEVLSLP